MEVSVNLNGQVAAVPPELLSGCDAVLLASCPYDAAAEVCFKKACSLHVLRLSRFPLSSDWMVWLASIERRHACQLSDLMIVQAVLGCAGTCMAEEGGMQGLQNGQALPLANGLVPNPHVGPDAQLQQSPSTPGQALGQSLGAGEPTSELHHEIL